MLSIIISSYQPTYFNALKRNIEETCGIEYEILKIDNPGLMGICKAYNIGAEQAKYDNLLFLHEDLIFYTKDWGKALLNHFQVPNVGMIGVAGSDYVPIAPCGWNVSAQHNYINIIQSDAKSEIKKEKITLNNLSWNRTPVFAIDGVFMGVKKEVFKNYFYDEKIEGYHGYDLDISLSVASEFQNFVIKDILIEHFSKGKIDKQWVINTIQIRKKHPRKYNKKIDQNVETEAYLNFLQTFFSHFGVYKPTIYTALKFFPFRVVSFHQKFALTKKVIRYLMNKEAFNKKYNV